ncbi:MAG: translation elongation factor Ts [Armatimonadota bacterium]|nr:translation elongation factor Ts [bacterium]MDW8320331.1 translation elongation factor Ts [Armatimonadota bacterium]
MEITAQMVKELREQTGAGMMECKQALIEAQGDMERARLILREKGAAAAVKRESRQASEGVVVSAVAPDHHRAALLELNAETDFVARNEEFQSLANELVQQLVDTGFEGTLEEFLQQPSQVAPDRTVRQRVEDLVARIREKIVVGRIAVFSTGNTGCVDTYIHLGGKIGVMVELKAASEAGAQHAETLRLARELGMQIAFGNPGYLTRDQVPQQLIEEEREVQRQRALNEGKPPQAIDKIVEGRLSKFFEQICLLDQGYIRDEKKSVKQVIEEFSQAVGEPLIVQRFTRFRVGEGGGA